MQRSDSRRAHKIADTILRELSFILLEEVQDPRLDMVSISGVRLNKDISIAEVMYTHGNDETKRKEVQKALESATGYMRKLLGQRLNMRRTPELRFRWDEYLEVMVYAQPSGTDTGDNNQ